MESLYYYNRSLSTVSLDSLSKISITSKPLLTHFRRIGFARIIPSPNNICSSTSEMSSNSSVNNKETKLWGGRFEESVTDAVEKFSESISYDKALYKQDILGSKAHATMLAKQGLMTESDRDIILQGLDEILKSIEAGKFVWRTDREDVHMNIEAALTDIIGEPAKKLHTARSRNDQVVTDLRLWCREAVDKIVIRIRSLQVALVNLAKKNEGLIVPGYTHMQRAQPILLPHLILSYVEQLERDAGRLTDCRGRLNFCPLGACALAVSDWDFVLEILSANSIAAVHLSRLGEEWVLWASEEFEFLTPNSYKCTAVIICMLVTTFLMILL